MTHGFKTADVDNIQEFPVRVETGNKSVQRTGKVIGTNQTRQESAFDFVSYKQVTSAGKNNILTTTMSIPTNADNFDAITPGPSDPDHYSLKLVRR